MATEKPMNHMESIIAKIHKSKNNSIKCTSKQEEKDSTLWQLEKKLTFQRDSLQKLKE